jgi:hypothetical protein
MHSNLMVQQHCCSQMQSMLDSQEIGLTYIGKYREYGFDYRDGGSAFQLINFCPWCGTELPKSLRREWFDRLESMGLDTLDTKIPIEYESAAWWCQLKVVASTSVKPKVLFELNEEGWDGSASETLWADKVSEGFVLDNIPFFKKGVCYQDVVEGIEIADGLYRYTRTVKKSTNSLYRVVYEVDKVDYAQPLLKKLEALGCIYATNQLDHIRLVAINIPLVVNADDAWEIIKTGKNSDIWEVQEGDDRHPQ